MIADDLIKSENFTFGNRNGNRLAVNRLIRLCLRMEKAERDGRNFGDGLVAWTDRREKHF